MQMSLNNKEIQLEDVIQIIKEKLNSAFSWSELPDAAKWLLSFLMLLGRLELFTVLLLFTSDFWKKN